MAKYKCPWCKGEFDEPAVIMPKHSTTAFIGPMKVCPFCGAPMY